jgi:hypothetical protein
MSPQAREGYSRGARGVLEGTRECSGYSVLPAAMSPRARAASPARRSMRCRRKRNKYFDCEPAALSDSDDDDGDDIGRQEDDARCARRRRGSMHAHHVAPAMQQRISGRRWRSGDACCKERAAAVSYGRSSMQRMRGRSSTYRFALCAVRCGRCMAARSDPGDVHGAAGVAGRHCRHGIGAAQPPESAQRQPPASTHARTHAAADAALHVAMLRPDAMLRRRGLPVACCGVCCPISQYAAGCVALPISQYSSTPKGVLRVPWSTDVGGCPLHAVGCLLRRRTLQGRTGLAECTAVVRPRCSAAPVTCSRVSNRKSHEGRIE